MDASYKIQRGIHVHLIQFFMCPEFWVHITLLPIAPRFCFAYFVIVCALLPPDLFMQTAPRKYFRGAVTSTFVQTAYQTTLPVTI